MIIQSNIDDYHSLSSKELKLKTEFETLQHQASKLDAYRNQIRIMEERFTNILKQLPTQNEMPSILEDISKMEFKKINFNDSINVKENLNISIDNLNKDLQKNDFSNILYFRTDQKIYREIYKFIKI